MLHRFLLLLSVTCTHNYTPAVQGSFVTCQLYLHWYWELEKVSPPNPPTTALLSEGTSMMIAGPEKRRGSIWKSLHLYAIWHNILVPDPESSHSTSPSFSDALLCTALCQIVEKPEDRKELPLLFFLKLFTRQQLSFLLPMEKHSTLTSFPRT